MVCIVTYRPIPEFTAARPTLTPRHMLTTLRYALAAVCFAASVGCLALWWRSATTSDSWNGPHIVNAHRELGLRTWVGLFKASISSVRSDPVEPWHYASSEISESEREFKSQYVASFRYFGALHYYGGVDIHFPIFYPAIIFALAGVASLRLGRRFTIRSAIIATTVVAGLLGIAAAL